MANVLKPNGKTILFKDIPLSIARRIVFEYDKKLLCYVVELNKTEREANQSEQSNTTCNY